MNMEPARFLDEWEALPAYALIAARYEGKIARRSGVPYVNHIREGAYLLSLLYGWDEELLSAYSLHPVFQSDRMLSDLLAPDGADDLAGLSPCVLVLGMEYRRVANSYTIKDPVRTPDNIELGPLESVHRMLVADKIQNKKDFCKHLYAAHERPSYRRAAEHSIAYFDSWLARLDVSPEQFTWGVERMEEMERAVADRQKEGPGNAVSVPEDSALL